MKRFLFLSICLLSSFSSILAQHIGIGTQFPTAQFHTTDTVRHENLKSGTGNFVVIDASGYLWRTTSTPLTNTQLLAQHSWMIDEAYAGKACGTVHYKRGVFNDTGDNYDPIRLTFNTNGTGTNVNSSGVTYPMTWQFTTPDEKNLKLVINGVVTNIWSLVNISENELLETTAFPNAETVSARWGPVVN